MLWIKALYKRSREMSHKGIRGNISCICIGIYTLSHQGLRLACTCASVFEALSHLKSITDMIWCCSLPVTYIQNTPYRGASPLLSDAFFYAAAIYGSKNRYAVFKVFYVICLNGGGHKTVMQWFI